MRVLALLRPSVRRCARVAKDNPFPTGTEQRSRRLDPEAAHDPDAERTHQEEPAQAAVVSAEVAEEATGLVPLYPDWAGLTAAGLVGRLHVRHEIHPAPDPVQPKAEVKVLHVQKIVFVHAAYRAIGGGRQHHARAADGRDAGGAVGERTFMVVEPVAAEEPRGKPVEPEYFDQGGERREQLPPRPALIGPVGIKHTTAEHPVFAERGGFGQQRGHRSGAEATVRVQHQQVTATRWSRVIRRTLGGIRTR